MPAGGSGFCKLLHAVTQVWCIPHTAAPGCRWAGAAQKWEFSACPHVALLPSFCSGRAHGKSADEMRLRGWDAASVSFTPAELRSCPWHGVGAAGSRSPCMAARPQDPAERARLSVGPSRQRSCPRHTQAHHGTHKHAYAHMYMQAPKRTCTHPHSHPHAQTQDSMFACILTPTSASTVNVPTHASTCTHAHAHMPPPACTPLEAGSQLSPTLRFVPGHFSPPTGAQGFCCPPGPVTWGNTGDGVEDIGPLGHLPAVHRAGGHIRGTEQLGGAGTLLETPICRAMWPQTTGRAGTEVACLGATWVVEGFTACR